MEKNILGTELQACGCRPKTGIYRDGYCRTSANDPGTHVVCARVTREFLEFSRRRGNDLITPRPQWDFPGLRPGDRWCLCVGRWLEAERAGAAPGVIMESTHEKALLYAPLSVFHAYALKPGDEEDAQ